MNGTIVQLTVSTNVGVPMDDDIDDGSCWLSMLTWTCLMPINIKDENSIKLRLKTIDYKWWVNLISDFLFSIHFFIIMCAQTYGSNLQNSFYNFEIIFYQFSILIIHSIHIGSQWWSMYGELWLTIQPIFWTIHLFIHPFRLLN